MQITIPMYEKGRAFLMACGLLKAYEGNNFVCLHLLGQAFENIGKAILLYHNYDKYISIIEKKSEIGHNLEKVIEHVNIVIFSNFISEAALSELSKLNKFYMNHEFRYGHEIDFNTDINSTHAEQLRGELINHLAEYNAIFTRG